MEILSYPLFKNITETEYNQILLLKCAREVTYEKNQIIFHTGDITDELGLISEGTINIESNDFWGNKSILNNVSKGQVFAETYALCSVPLMVDVTAMEKTTVLFFNLKILLSQENIKYPWQTRLMHNLLMLSSNKNLVLSNRIFCTSPKHIRSRVMTYLSSQAVGHSNNNITIPFNRQQMADYLNVERTALSKELSRMKKDGIIDYWKNSFKLYNE